LRNLINTGTERNPSALDRLQGEYENECTREQRCTVISPRYNIIPLRIQMSAFDSLCALRPDAKVELYRQCCIGELFCTYSRYSIIA